MNAGGDDNNNNNNAVDGYSDHERGGENRQIGESEDARRERRTSRDLEEGFRDDSDDEEAEERGEGQRDGLRQMPPTPLEDERRFPAARI